MNEPVGTYVRTHVGQEQGRTQGDARHTWAWNPHFTARNTPSPILSPVWLVRSFLSMKWEFTRNANTAVGVVVGGTAAAHRSTRKGPVRKLQNRSAACKEKAAYSTNDTLVSKYQYKISRCTTRSAFPAAASTTQQVSLAARAQPPVTEVSLPLLLSKQHKFTTIQARRPQSRTL